MKYLVPMYVWRYGDEYRIYSTVDPERKESKPRMTVWRKLCLRLRGRKESKG